MIVKTTLKDNSAELKEKVAVFADALMGLMAAGIDSRMKTGGEVPFLPKSTKWAQRGALRSSIRHNKLAPGRYEVTVGQNSPAEAYAGVQEAGEARGRTFKNYSTPGTGAHFFQHAVDATKEKAIEYIRAAQDAAGMRGL